MTQHTMGRRGLLRGAGVATGGAVLGGIAMSDRVRADGGDDDDDDRDRGRGRAAGSWLVTRFDPEDGVERTFVFNLANGGSCIMHDISPVFITGLGAWKARGRKLTATVWVGTPDMPPEQPAVTFKVEVDGNIRGDEMSGTFTYVVFLPDRTTQIGAGEGVFEGSRITT